MADSFYNIVAAIVELLDTNGHTKQYQAEKKAAMSRRRYGVEKIEGKTCKIKALFNDYPRRAQ